MDDWFGVELAPLAGGYSGETFVAGVGDDAAVVRVYARNPERAVIDAALLRLLRGVAPVPSVIESRAPTDESPGLLVTGLVPGVSLDQVLARPPRRLDWEELGLSLGYLLGRLSCLPYLRPGAFVDADLTLSSAGFPSDLRAWAQHHRDTGRLATWQEHDWSALLELIDQAGDLLDTDVDTPADRTVLVHSDFNPKNILVDTREWYVTALVDWEFAHAGSVYADFGNFTRFERDDRLIEPMIEAMVDTAPSSLRDPYGKGRAVDLWALIELAGRPHSNPVAEMATTLLLAQARDRDLDAWPWPGTRRAPTDA